MSGGFDSGGSRNNTAEGGSVGAVETAKSEAGAVKNAAVDAAKGTAHTAKEEVAAVAGTTKSQVKDLYAQTRTELETQASQQQERLVTGLRAVGDELGSMARNAESGGIATDFAQQVSTRLSGAAEWLGEREPADVLDEVKRFARRRPLVFIAGAAVAGIVAGRLVRSLAAAQHHDSTTGTLPEGSPSPERAPALTAPSVVATTAPAGDSPLFDSASQTVRNPGRPE